MNVVRPLSTMTRLSIPLAAIAFSSLAGLSLSTPAAQAADFADCAATLTGLGLAAPVAANACAGAQFPADLSSCTDRLTSSLKLTAADSLAACRSVRKPLAVASCAERLQAAGDATPALIADGCRLSLVPERYANCVLGLGDGLDLTRDQLLRACSNNGDVPRRIYPNFTTLGETQRESIPAVSPAPRP
uniref:Uncharacterized protein n=1 Tax=Synechococcus elongatus (strain ATCC 33912 / PCC 7942 / FACHB-805) TaxID=1140 RepID=Q8GA99_SYNE7|nr:hypothetical protein [Synechococcus elongatus PCC 7942 = FACHB-805]